MADGGSDTETTILDAALAEVLEHGIRRTSVSDIARRAGIARQTLYRYWPDAQALFASLVTRELLAALPPVPADEHPARIEDLVAVLVGTADEIRRMPLVDRLRDTDPELFARYVLERLGTSQRAIHADLVGRIRAGQRSGVVRDDDPSGMAAMVLLIVQSAIQSAPLVVQWLPEDAWRAELSHALTGHLSPAAGER